MGRIVTWFPWLKALSSESPGTGLGVRGAQVIQELQALPLPAPPLCKNAVTKGTVFLYLQAAQTVGALSPGQGKHMYEMYMWACLK